MRQDQLEEIQTLYKRHMEAFTREMETVASNPTPEEQREIQQAISSVPQEGAVGIDLLSLLKSINMGSAVALEALQKKDFATGAEVFAELNQLIGGYKLPMLVKIMRHMSEREKPQQ